MKKDKLGKHAHLRASKCFPIMQVMLILSVYKCGQNDAQKVYYSL